MKKLVLALAVIASVSLISCTGQTEKAEENVVDTPAVVEEVAAPVDTPKVEEAAAPAAEEAAAPAAEEAAPAEEPAK